MAGQLANADAKALHPTGAAPATGAGSPPPIPAPPPIPQGPGFFFAVDGKPLGPFDAAALRAHVAGQSLTPGTLVWRDGMPQWAPARTVPEVAALLGGAT